MPELRVSMSEESLHGGGGPPPATGGWSPRGHALVAASPPLLTASPPLLTASPPLLTAVAASSSAAAAADADAPLDLSTRAGESSAGDEAACVDMPSEHCQQEQQPLVMDLSLPARDSPVEACYTCGALVRRSTLQALLVLRRHRDGDEPFFPSLLEQRRPAGSRPMSPDGRVNVCAGCLQSMFSQWEDYQRDNVVIGRRSYAVTAADGSMRRSGDADEPAAARNFVCYMCCLTYSTACLSRVRVTPGAGGESFFADILRPTTPPGAESVRGGAVSVCVNCKRKAALRQALQRGLALPEDSRCYRIIEEAVRGGGGGATTSGGGARTAGGTRMRPLPAAAVPNASTFHNIRVRRQEVVCLSCRGTHQHDFMSEVRFHSSDATRMHFPALAALPRLAGAVVGGGGALVCVPCYRMLKKQWHEYQESGAALAGRVYTTRRGSCGSGAGSDPARGSPALPDTPPAGGEAAAAALRRLSPQLQPAVSGTQGLPTVQTAAATSAGGGVCEPAQQLHQQSPTAAADLDQQGDPAGQTSGGSVAGRAEQTPVPAEPQRKSQKRSLPSGESHHQQVPSPKQQRRSPAAAPPSSPSPPTADSATSPSGVPAPMSLVAPSSVTAGCYACHQPLEANCAYQVRTEPDQQRPEQPFFPHLSQRSSLPVPVTSVAVCVYCFHTLADQWARYERLSQKIDPYHREYDTHNFICFVCSVRTYRKRLHVIDVKDFPFLTASHRYPEGALLICSKTKSVVCRDCHGTLHCQFQDYERWNLPVSKREYNWVTRPPPPESPEPGGRPDTVIVRYVAQST